MEHFADLPILFTEDYSELTPEYLDQEYNRMLDIDYAIEKLHLNHWRGQIEAAIGEYGGDRADVRVA